MTTPNSQNVLSQFGATGELTTAVVNSLSASQWKARIGPSGIHLFSPRTGVNVLLDGVRTPTHLWSKVPRQISIALTNACELACNYCYAPKYAALLETERVRAWLDELDSNGCMGIGFGGGEPTLHQGLPELCRHTRHNTTMAVTLTTHGHRFDDGLAARLAGNVDFIRVSMDGIGDTYETMRGRSFKDFTRRLQSVRQVAPFGINYVVNSKTVSDLDAAVDFAARMGAVEFLILPQRAVGRASGIDLQSTNELHEWVRRYRGQLLLTVSESGSEGLPTCSPHTGETALQGFAHIDASGLLKRTSYDEIGIAIGEKSLVDALYALQNF